MSDRGDDTNERQRLLYVLDTACRTAEEALEILQRVVAIIGARFLETAPIEDMISSASTDDIEDAGKHLSEILRTSVSLRRQIRRSLSRWYAFRRLLTELSSMVSDSDEVVKRELSKLSAYSEKVGSNLRQMSQLLLRVERATKSVLRVVNEFTSMRSRLKYMLSNVRRLWLSRWREIKELMGEAICTIADARHLCRLVERGEVPEDAIERASKLLSTAVSLHTSANDLMKSVLERERDDLAPFNLVVRRDFSEQRVRAVLNNARVVSRYLRTAKRFAEENARLLDESLSLASKLLETIGRRRARSA